MARLVIVLICLRRSLQEKTLELPIFNNSKWNNIFIITFPYKMLNLQLRQSGVLNGLLSQMVCWQCWSLIIYFRQKRLQLEYSLLAQAFIRNSLIYRHQQFRTKPTSLLHFTSTQKTYLYSSKDGKTWELSVSNFSFVLDSFSPILHERLYRTVGSTAPLPEARRQKICEQDFLHINLSLFLYLPVRHFYSRKGLEGKK